MKEQIKQILLFIEDEQQKGRALSKILKNLNIPRSNYYRWVKRNEKNEIKSSSGVNPRIVSKDELLKIDQMKEKNPEMRHRQIQGMMQLEGNYLSATTVYKRLKTMNKVEPYERRAAPWDEPFYEIWRPNMMWGSDWTKLRIGGIRWYLLTLIDFHSRKIIHFEIIPTVNASHIKSLYKAGLATLNLPKDWPRKPELRVDQGSPNTSKVTKEFFKDIQADLSFARVARPTDNARTERFYRTIKQEEIYIVGDYQDIQTAKEVIGEYINWYNEKRPHQALWNYTPEMVHQEYNKTNLIYQLKDLKRKTWERRKEYWMTQKVNKIKL